MVGTTKNQGGVQGKTMNREEELKDTETEKERERERKEMRRMIVRYV